MIHTQHPGMTENLSVHFSADPDDAFAWWGAFEGRVDLTGMRFTGVAGNVHQNNLACRDEVPDIAAISSASYPELASNYAVLSSGASVGRGYGPALIARVGVTLDEALGAPIAVAGLGTTGGTLLRVLYPKTEVVEIPWRKIPAAVASGRVGAGVAIHETLMLWRQAGLRRIACLGERWQTQTGHPLPMGLVVAHRRLGEPTLRLIADVLRRSVEAAFRNRTEAMNYAAQYSLTSDRSVTERFVDSFTNSDTVDLPADACAGLDEFYRRMATLGLCAMKPQVDLIFPPSQKEMSA